MEDAVTLSRRKLLLLRENIANIPGVQITKLRVGIRPIPGVAAINNLKTVSFINNYIKNWTPVLARLQAGDFSDMIEPTAPAPAPASASDTDDDDVDPNQPAADDIDTDDDPAPASSSSSSSSF
jgi:hypothetical protein